MNKSLFSELYDKVFRSGNPLYLFLGINILVFLAINLFAAGEFLTGRGTPVANWLTIQLSVPARISDVPLKLWTVITYMFTHRSFFHILFNMLWLYWLGMIFLDFLNKRQFIFTYLAGGIAGAILYLLAFNFIPVYTAANANMTMLGASASVMAIIAGAATLVPDYTIRLLFFGNVKLKYLAIAYFVLDLIGVGGAGAGGSIAHIGGAVLGFVYIRQLNHGNDLSLIFQRKSKSKLKVVRNAKPDRSKSTTTDQEVIDRILDKISQSGYESLTKAEKEQLFKASKK